MHTNTKKLVQCALFAALLAACSQLVIPLPMISINLALFAVHLSGAVLGPRWGTAAGWFTCSGKPADMCSGMSLTR